MKNTSDIKGKARTAAIEKEACESRLDSVTEAAHACLRSPGEQERKMELLRTAIREGEMSGEPKPFDIEKFLADKKKGR
jgi:antitoxin ParD1/3/4